MRDNFTGGADAAITVVLDDHAAVRGVRLRERLGNGIDGSRRERPRA